MSTANIVLSGTVAKVNEKQNITDTFSKRTLWMDVDEDTDYKQQIEVEFVNDKCALLNGVKEGSTVTVDANLRGKEFESKKKPGEFFRPTKLNGWRIKGAEAEAPPPPTAPADNGGGDQGPDDLPF